MIGLDHSSAELLEAARTEGHRHLRPLGIRADRTGAPPPADDPFFAACARRGGIVEAVSGEDPPDLGGSRRAWRPLRSVLLAEECAYWDRGVTRSLPGPGLAGAALRSVATAEQRERFLGPFADRSRPRWAAVWARGTCTEPAAAQLRADGDAVVLRGTVEGCANGARADWIVVWAHGELAPGRRPLGNGADLRAVVVERGTPGLRVIGLEHKMGMRGHETAVLSLDDARVPLDNVLGGDRPAPDLRRAMAGYDVARPTHAAHLVGTGRAAMDRAAAIVSDDFPSSGRRRDRALEDLAARRRQLHAARLLCLQAAWLATNGRDASRESAWATAAAVGAAGRAVTTALEIAGTAGVRSDVLLEKLYRDVLVPDG